jgi:TolB-like protein/tetratricopeptide (TPR) repeat protein
MKPADFELDVGAYELRRGGRSVSLERIPMELLLLLVERQGQLVTRGEIVARLWGKDVFVDVDNSINAAIRKLRIALTDDPVRSTFIKTLTGKGYRFVAPIRVLTPGPAASVRSAAAPVMRVMLAVLPFQNLSGDPAQEYFGDGLTEETICHLGRINPQRMGVIARTTSMAYRNTAKSIGQIGKELGVNFLLESSVRREGAQVRITAQLIRADDQTHVWAATYDRDASSFLGVQDELGRAIAREVHVQLTPRDGGAGRAYTDDPDAYDLCLRGRYFWNQLSPRGISRAIEYFQQAVARDPDYALAYSGLADCFAMLPVTSDAQAAEVFTDAKQAACHAVELDPSLAETHSSMGCIKLWMEWDWPGAESAFRRAIELNPSYVASRRWFGHLLSNLGRHAESAAELEEARRLDPFSPMMHALSGNLLYQARRYDAALKHVRDALAINPELWVAHLFLAKICERKGLLDDALGACQKALELSGGVSEPVALRGYILAACGHQAGAEDSLRVLTDLARQRYVPPYNIAIVYAGLGSIKSALDCLDRAYETGDVRLTWLAVEPKWDFMRQNARFQDLLGRLRLPPGVVAWV